MAAHVNKATGFTPPAGAIYHTEGPTNDGHRWAFDVWESVEARHAFETAYVAPALEALGITEASSSGPLQVQWDTLQMISRG